MFPRLGGRGSFPKVPYSHGRLRSFLEAFNSGSRREPFAALVNSRDRRRGSFPEASYVFKGGLQLIPVLLVIFRGAEAARVVSSDVSLNCFLWSKVFCFCSLGFPFSFIYIA